MCVCLLVYGQNVIEKDKFLFILNQIFDRFVYTKSNNFLAK